MLINVFAISLFLILFLIAIKLWEKEAGKKMFLSRFISKGDVYLNRLKAKVWEMAHDSKHKTIFFILFHLPEQIEAFFGNLKKKAHDKYYHMNAKVRGKQNLNSTSDISPFMRNITPGGDKRRFEN